MKKLVVSLVILLILVGIVFVSFNQSVQEAPITPEPNEEKIEELAETPTPPSNEALKSNILVVVNSEIYSSIQPELIQYKADLESENYTVQVISYSCKTASQLRETIKSYALDGIFLIGDFPAAWFEIYPYTMEIEDGTYEYPSYNVFSTDLYYMDLDGIWTDSDGNGYFDSHTGNTKPEVFFGRLTTGNLDLLGDEVGIIKDYLRRNHQYRIGAMEVKDKALIYWCSEFDAGIRCREVLREIYTTVDILDYRHIPHGGIDLQGGSKEDFLQKIKADYQFVMLGGVVHSSSNGVSMGEDYLTRSDLVNANPQSQFYVIHSCANSKYTNANFIAGYFAYGGKGLIAIGTSSAGGGIGRGQTFYDSLQFGASFGEAIKDFFTCMVSTNTPEQYISYHHAAHCYSTILLGDPTLKITK